MLNTLVRAANTLTLAVILQEQSLVRAERLKEGARRKERIKMTNDEIKKTTLMKKEIENMDNSNNTSKGGIGFCGLLAIAFIVLK